MPFDFEVLHDILACPESHSDFVVNGDGLVSTDPSTRRQYPILHNIPRLIVDESTVLSEDDWSRIMVRNQRDPTTGESPPTSGG